MQDNVWQPVAPSGIIAAWTGETVYFHVPTGFQLLHNVAAHQWKLSRVEGGGQHINTIGVFLYDGMEKPSAPFNWAEDLLARLTGTPFLTPVEPEEDVVDEADPVETASATFDATTGLLTLETSEDLDIEALKGLAADVAEDLPPDSVEVLELPALTLDPPAKPVRRGKKK